MVVVQSRQSINHLGVITKGAVVILGCLMDSG